MSALLSLAGRCEEARDRIPYGQHGTLRSNDHIIVRKRGGGERIIPCAKWWINRNTPVGEDADLYERMPHDGRRYVEWHSVLAVLRARAAMEGDGDA